MSLLVVFTPEAQSQLLSIYNYIARVSYPETAKNYVDAVISYCEQLKLFPYRGILREDIRPGLRVINYKKRVVIAFASTENTLSIIGIFYRGQNYEELLHNIVPNFDTEEQK